MYLGKRDAFGSALITALGVITATIYFDAVLWQDVPGQCGEDGNKLSCAATVVGAVSLGLVAALEVGVLVYTVAAGTFIKRGEVQVELPWGWELVQVDGRTLNSSEVFTHAWLRDNLVHEKRTHILTNSTHGPGHPQYMMEAWLEGDSRKFTSYVHHGDGGHAKRTGPTFYVHTDAPQYIDTPVQKPSNFGALERNQASAATYEALKAYRTNAACLKFFIGPNYGYEMPSAQYVGFGITLGSSGNNAPSQCGTLVEEGAFAPDGDWRISDFPIS